MRVSLPNDWSGVSLKQFSEIYDLIQDKSIDNIDREIRTLSILSGLSSDQLEDLSLTNLKLLLEKVDFTKGLPSEKPVDSFKHAGYTWKINKDITKLTAGEYISLTHFTKDGQNIMNNMPQILSIFCKPYKFKFFKKEIPFKKSAELLQDSSIAIVYPLSVFFCNLLTNYILITEAYLKEDLMTMNRKLETELSHLKSIGDG